MKIGDKIWIFDENHRIYVDDEGNRYSSPIYRKKFVEHYILDETRVSWIISRSNPEETPDLVIHKGKKVKKIDANKMFWTSEEELDKHCWVVDNYYRISEKVKMCKDYDLLKQIDKMIK